MGKCNWYEFVIDVAADSSTLRHSFPHSHPNTIPRIIYARSWQCDSVPHMALYHLPCAHTCTHTTFYTLFSLLLLKMDGSLTHMCMHMPPTHA